MSAPPDDARLRALLAERDRGDQAQAVTDAAGLTPGHPCPCGQDLLAARPSRLAALHSAPGLRCPGCGFQVPPVPSVAGLALAGLGAAALGVCAVSVALRGHAQVATGPRSLHFLVGALLTAVAYVWVQAWWGDHTRRPLARYLYARRQRERGWPLVPRPGSNLLLDFVVGAVVFLIARHYVVEPFVIPTGSMAPTLKGEHFQLTCTRCGHRFAVGRARSDFGHGPLASVEGRCPLCAETLLTERGRGKLESGDMILVDKLAYRLRAPQRWDLMVFRFPRTPWVYYIKRLVGLPGEVLRIREGDLFADDVLQRKPPAVQDAIWLPVHDSAQGYDGAAACWQLDDPGWEVAPDGRWLTCAAEGATPRWARYYPDRHGVVDDTSYNRGWRRGVNPVGDLRVEVELIGEPGATLRLATLEDGRRVTAVFPVADGPASFGVEVDGRPQVQATRPGLTPGQPHRVALAYADDRARLLVDGETILTWDDVHAPQRPVDHATCALGAAGARVDVRHVRIDRDVYYVQAPRGATDPARKPVRVPLGNYFGVGDNSPNSEDGRTWGFVAEGHLVGRAFAVWWPRHDAGLVR